MPGVIGLRSFLRRGKDFTVGIILTLTSDFNEARLVSGCAFVGKLMADNAI